MVYFPAMAMIDCQKFSLLSTSAPSHEDEKRRGGKARLRERLRRGTHPSSPQRQPLASHGFPKKDSQLWINVDQLCRKGQKGLVIFHCHFGRVEGWPTWLYQQHIACSQAPSKDQGSTNKYIITIFVVHYIITSTLLQQISTSLQ